MYGYNGNYSNNSNNSNNNNYSDNYNYEVSNQVQSTPVYTPLAPVEHFEEPAPSPVFSSDTSKPKDRITGDKRFLAIALTAIICSSALGVGSGVGGRMYDNYMANKNTSAEFTQSMGSISESGVLELPQIENSTASNESGIKTSPYSGTLALTASDADVVSVIKTVSNSIVSINITTLRTMFNRIYPEQGAGSGIIFQEDNQYIYIVTNYHVIENASTVEISIDDNTSVAASPVGSDAESDISVIKVAKADLISAGINDYSIAVFGDSANMEVGETVIAIGNALGEGKSATLGIISAKNKHVEASSNNYIDLLQTDAAINQGNSGGALVNLKGQVIGVNTIKFLAAGVEGMGYAIPSDSVSEIVEQIISEGTVERPYLGISGITVTEQIKTNYNLSSYGVYIAEISAKSGAQDAGLKPGDIITSFNGVNILDMDSLQSEIAKAEVGEKITVEFYRDNEIHSVSVEMKDSNQYKSF